MARKFNKHLTEGIVSLSHLKARHVLIMFLMTRRVSNVFFSASDDSISQTFSLRKITLLIIKVWDTNGAQTDNGIFKTSKKSTYISQLTCFNVFFSVGLTQRFHAGGLFQRARARSQGSSTCARLHPRKLPKRGNLCPRYYIDFSTTRQSDSLISR